MWQLYTLFVNRTCICWPCTLAGFILYSFLVRSLSLSCWPNIFMWCISELKENECLKKKKKEKMNVCLKNLWLFFFMFLGLLFLQLKWSNKIVKANWTFISPTVQTGKSQSLQWIWHFHVIHFGHSSWMGSYTLWVSWNPGRFFFRSLCRSVSCQG